MAAGYPLAGRLVGLGPLRRELIPLYAAWSNDRETSRTAGLSWPMTDDAAEREYERRSAAPDGAYFTIHELGGGLAIGVCHLFEISQRHRRASFGITIGDAGFRGRGCGTEATGLALAYAFDELHLSNVMLTTVDFNEAGIRAYRNAGFTEFGRRRACSAAGGRLVDLIYMECLAEEWRRRGPEQVSGVGEG